MANTLTGLIPTIYESLDVVSRELTGFIPAVARNSSAERAALNQTIDVPVVPQGTLSDTTPAVTAPNSGDQVIGVLPMTISKSKFYPVRWNGEEQRGLINAGTYGGILKNQFSQAFRTLCNQIETDLAVAAYQGASRAYGTAGTAPFGTANDLSDAANVRKILDDNGAPTSDLHLVLGTAAMANVRGKQSVLFKVNEAGTDDLLRNGVIGRLEGFNLHTSAGVQTPVKGTITGAVTSGPAAVGATSIPITTGVSMAVALVAGDVVTFAGDTNKYVVAAPLTLGASTTGTLIINLPGLLVAQSGSANAISVGNTAAQNVAFDRNAIQLVARAPAMPVGPDGKPMDMADDVIQVTDPVTGIVFDVAVYRQFMQMVYHVRLAWGVAVVKSNHVANLLG